MSSFFGRLVGGSARKSSPKRHVKRSRARVVRVHVPTFTKQKRRVYYKSRSEDAKLSARKPGKRGKRYYEYRVNRSDLSRKTRL